MSKLIRSKILKFSEDIDNIKCGLEVYIQAGKEEAPRGEFVGALLDKNISIEIINAFDILNEARYVIGEKDFPRNLVELTTWVDKYTTDLLMRDLDLQRNLSEETPGHDIVSTLEEDNNANTREIKRTL